MNNLNQSENYSWELLQSNPAAFELFFKGTAGAFCAYAFRIVKDRHAAEDLVQDFFSKLWQRRHEITITTTPVRYAYRALHNACLNYLRDQKPVSGDFLPEDLSADEQEIEEAIRRQEQIQQLEKAITTLPQQCRIIFEKTCLQQKKYKEVAAELGISIFTVRNQVSKAYEILRNHLFLEVICFLVADFLLR